FPNPVSEFKHQQGNGSVQLSQRSEKERTKADDEEKISGLEGMETNLMEIDSLSPPVPSSQALKSLSPFYARDFEEKCQGGNTFSEYGKTTNMLGQGENSLDGLLSAYEENDPRFLLSPNTSPQNKGILAQTLISDSGSKTGDSLPKLGPPR
ncbi:hypothetical protein U1Q18_021319, partial [Sarracenia purpurea var. burkii]